MIPQPWECPKCGTIIAPWVSEHRCEGDTGGAEVGAKPSPGDPPGGLVVHQHIAGSVLSAQDLAGTLGRALREYDRRNPLIRRTA